MSGWPWWETLLLSSAAPVVIASVSILVTARLSQHAVHEAQETARKAEARADDERDRADKRRRYERYLVLVQAVIEGLQLPPGARRRTPYEVAVLVEDEATRRARIALDCLPVTYLPLHRVLLLPGDPRDAAAGGLAADDAICRQEARVTLKALLAGSEPPAIADYNQADAGYNRAAVS